jgi:cell division septation protein DedD
MKGTSKTRIQRRMEKRQAVILLVLVLVVSLASFTLGVIVGRRGAERDLAQKFQQAERVLVTHAPTPVALPSPMADTEKGIVTPAGEPVPEETKLSFYDDLAKETAPLGSGINLAPVEEQTVVTATQPPIDLPDQPIIKKTSPAATVVVAKVSQNKPAADLSDSAESVLPKAVVNGSHAVQIGSFGVAGDAITLKKKMVGKKYPAFVVEADLGTKGLWYRVRIGPYQDSAAAKKAQKFLEEKEKIKGFITRQ